MPEDEEMQDPPPPQPAQLAYTRMGWTLVAWFPELDPKAFFHELLLLALNRYYPNLQATLEYCRTEHRHPLRRSLWDAEPLIKTLDATKGIRRVESKHLSRVSRTQQRRVWLM